MGNSYMAIAIYWRRHKLTFAGTAPGDIFAQFQIEHGHPHN